MTKVGSQVKIIEWKYTIYIVTFQYIQTYTSKFVNVGMIYFCNKPNFWGWHGVIFW